MEKMNNITYSIKIIYINNSGENVSIYKSINDNGLEINTIQVGDISISEETINGRILSGRYDCSSTYCGYKYNYEKNNSEYLVNINENVLLETAVSLINNAKMQPNFLSAKMVLSAISRNDYRIFPINKGNLNITKTVTAENENNEKFFMQKNISLSKLESEESFSETNVDHICKINDVVTDLNSNQNSKIKAKLNKLLEIIDQNPNSYKDLSNLEHDSYTTDIV